MIRWRIVPQADDKGLVCPGPGLLVTTGDGIAVAVTGELLARARWCDHIEWSRFSKESQATEIAEAQRNLDDLCRHLTALSRPADGATP